MAARRPFGQIAIDMGLLTPEQLQEALAIQRAQPARPLVGVVLVNLGFMTGDQVCEVLSQQECSDAPGGVDATVRLDAPAEGDGDAAGASAGRRF